MATSGVPSFKVSDSVRCRKRTGPGLRLLDMHAASEPWGDAVEERQGE